MGFCVDVDDAFEAWAIMAESEGDQRAWDYMKSHLNLELARKLFEKINEVKKNEN